MRNIYSYTLPVKCKRISVTDKCGFIEFHLISLCVWTCLCVCECVRLCIAGHLCGKGGGERWLDSCLCCCFWACTKLQL